MDFDARGYLDPGEVIARLRPDTKAVVMNHGSNVPGTVQPVAEIGRACRARGVHLVLDVSQTAGMVDVKLDDLGTDKLHGAARFGIGAFNTAADIRTAVEGVADIAGMQRRR